MGKPISESEIFNLERPEVILMNYTMEELEKNYEPIYINASKHEYVNNLVINIWKKYRKVIKVAENLYYDYFNDCYLDENKLIFNLSSYSVLSLKYLYNQVGKEIKNIIDDILNQVMKPYIEV
ncbi:MAG: hypothetical protein QW478_00595 [Candidatus Micrarchaeaceae archaeon]